MGGLLHLVQLGGTGKGHSQPRPILAVPNVTAGVPITASLDNGPFLCGFNVPSKGLIKSMSNMMCGLSSNFRIAFIHDVVLSTTLDHLTL